MKKIIFPVGEGELAVRIGEQNGSNFVTIIIDQVPQGADPEKMLYWLRVTDADGVERHDAFDHLYEALDSLTGIVKTLEKEI